MSIPEINKDFTFQQAVRTGGYTYDSFTGSQASLSDSTKRQRLTADIRRMRTIVVPEHINNNIKARAGELPDLIPSYGMAEGTVMLNGHYDGTTRTGKIIPNQPVVLDYTTGKTVTGINSAWQSTEYFVVGVALDKLETVGTKKILVRITPPPTERDDFFLAQVQAFSGSQTLVDWSKGGTNGTQQQKVFSIKKLTPTFNFENKYTALTTTVESESNWVYSLSGHYLIAGDIVKVFAMNDLYWTDYRMPELVHGYLTEDIYLDEPANPFSPPARGLATVSMGVGTSSQVYAYSMVYDPTLVIPSGTAVSLQLSRFLVGTTYVWRYLIVSSDGCGVPANYLP